MLAKKNRIRTQSEFRAVMRDGVRTGAGAGLTLVVAATGASRPGRVGLVVGTKVGNAVVRHALARKLRHQMRPWLDGEHPIDTTGLDIVILTRPGAGELSSVQIAAGLSAMERAVAKARRAAPAGAAQTGRRSSGS